MNRKRVEIHDQYCFQSEITDYNAGWAKLRLHRFNFPIKRGCNFDAFEVEQK